MTFCLESPKTSKNQKILAFGDGRTNGAEDKKENTVHVCTIGSAFVRGPHGLIRDVVLGDVSQVANTDGRSSRMNKGREEERKYQLPACLASCCQNSGNCLKVVRSLQLSFSPTNYRRRESGYTSSEHAMPVQKLIFMRHCVRKPVQIAAFLAMSSSQVGSNSKSNMAEIYILGARRMDCLRSQPRRQNLY